MSKEVVDNLTYPAFGALTSIGIGAFLLELLRALIRGTVGASGGWAVKEFVIPCLNKKFKRT